MLAVTAALAAGWLEDRRHVDIVHLVKTVEVYQFTGNS